MGSNGRLFCFDRTPTGSTHRERGLEHPPVGPKHQDGLLGEDGSARTLAGPSAAVGRARSVVRSCAVVRRWRN